MNKKYTGGRLACYCRLNGCAEYNYFLKWAEHLNNYHPEVIDTVHIDVPKNYHPLCYQTKA